MVERMKTYWITGASQGLGRSLALEAARNGERVVASARGRESLESLVQEAASLPGEVVALPLDVLERDAVVAGAEEIAARFGAVDVAVLNAGTHQAIDSRELRTEDFRKLVELNLMGTVHCLEAVIPGMVARQAGRIAIVGSLAGYCGLPSASAYGMTKAGLINLAQTLRAELSLDGIDVQIVNPGFVRTPLTDRNDFEMPFLMEPEDAARAFYSGLQGKSFEIAFPRRFALIMRVLKNLPDWLFFSMTRKMAAQRRGSA